MKLYTIVQDNNNKTLLLLVGQHHQLNRSHLRYLCMKILDFTKLGEKKGRNIVHIIRDNEYRVSERKRKNTIARINGRKRRKATHYRCFITLFFLYFPFYRPLKICLPDWYAYNKNMIERWKKIFFTCVLQILK